MQTSTAQMITRSLLIENSGSSKRRQRAQRANGVTVSSRVTVSTEMLRRHDMIKR